jgi:hypothetical protein
MLKFRNALLAIIKPCHPNNTQVVTQLRAEDRVSILNGASGDGEGLMRNAVGIFTIVALFGAFSLAQAPAVDQTPASSQRPDGYEQGPPPPSEAKLPEIPPESSDRQQPLPGEEQQPVRADEQQPISANEQQPARSDGQQPLPVETQQSRDSQESSTPVLKTRPQPAKTIPTNRTLAAGTEIRASLDRVISSKSSQAGDEFTATIIEPLMNQEGQVLVHSGAKIHGRIAGLERGKVFGSLRNASARLNLRFTDVMLDSGESVPIQASLIGLDESSTNSKAKSNEEGDINPTGTDPKEILRDIGMGAGGGTLAGLILGSAWKGAIIGAIAGGGYMLANQGRDVELPASTGLRVRLDKYLTIPEYALQHDAAAQPPASNNTDYSQADNQGDSSNDRPVLKRRPPP